MARWAAAVEYDGSPYCGWQIQDGQPSVQAAVEAALSKVADHRVAVQCAGRTDTGVHATGQVIHFDSNADREPRSWVFGGNANLPPSIALLWAHPVSESFNARFSAVARRYRYIITNREVRPAILHRRAVWDRRPLDADAMARAADPLVGTHDFTSYRAVACQAKSPVRTIHELTVERRGSLIHIDVEANAFLHHMVRTLAGTLMAVGAGEADEDWPRRVLEARDRRVAGMTARPGGLYLTAVRYPEAFGLPALSGDPGLW